MSFFERAKAAAGDLARQADTAMTNAGISVPGAGPDRALRDLGVIAWLDANGRPVEEADRDRVLTTLRELEAAGRLGSLTVTPAQPYGTPPPPPGAAATGAGVPATPPPPPAGGSAPPPPPGGVMPMRDTPPPPPPGSGPDQRPPLQDPDEVTADEDLEVPSLDDEPPPPPPSSAPPPPPPPSWA